MSCSSAKVFHLQAGLYVTMDNLHFYLHDYHDSTRLIPNVVKISRNQYFEWGRTNMSYNMVLEKGKSYCSYIFTKFGYIPVIPVNEDNLCPNGFVIVEDTFFDEEFEKIVLDKEKK